VAQKENFNNEEIYIDRQKSGLEGSTTREFDLQGLNCANCALKIEESIGRIAGVRTASVSFALQKMKLEIDGRADVESIVKKTKKIAGTIENGMRLTEARPSCPTDRKETKIQKSIKPGDSKHKAVNVIRFGAGLALLIGALLWKGTEWIGIAFYITSYLLIGGDVLFGAIQNLFSGQLFDEKFLMSVATIGAFSIKEYPEAVSVMLFYQIGEFVQESAVAKSRKSISGLLGIRPDYASIRANGELIRVCPEEVHTGDTIWVRPGERIPIDGHVLSGEAAMDLSALTGESLPKNIVPGDIVLSGSINLSGVLEIQTDKEFGESTVSKILEIVQNASSRKAPIERFITKFSRIYTPIVVGTALILAVVPPLVFAEATFSDWLYRALVFLVVSCPCALVISIPLGLFGGIGGASKNGILVKGGNYLEALNNVDTVVFDKTGTLTKGVFAVTKIVSMIAGNDRDTILKYASEAEVHSNHPIAHSIRRAYQQRVEEMNAPLSGVREGGNSKTSLDDMLESYEEIPGSGIRIVTQGDEILVGNTTLMETNEIPIPAESHEESGTLIHVVRNKEYLGYLLISDEVKKDAKEAVTGLKSLGVERIVMLTGDRKSVGESIARSLGISEVYAELLPVQKVEQLERIALEKKTKGALLFVGDGINDAPVLARSDVGFAMGGVGSDAAIEAADVIIMTDEPSKVVHAIHIAKRTKTIVWQNIILALSIKAIVLLLAAFGVATMWEAVFADVGVAVLAVLNSTRAMK
jgi:Cd2+/Zn2+-exporting ATPase